MPPGPARERGEVDVHAVAVGGAQQRQRPAQHQEGAARVRLQATMSHSLERDLVGRRQQAEHVPLSTSAWSRAPGVADCRPWKLFWIEAGFAQVRGGSLRCAP